MQQEKDRGFSLPALGLGMVTATLAGSFYGKAGAYSARSVLLLGLLSALALAALCRMFALWAQKTGLFDGSGFLPRLAGWGFFLWFGAEFVRTAVTAQTVCREHFASNALIAVLPLLLLASWQLNAAALDRAARALWWLLAAGVLVCLAGLWDQMSWPRLLADSPAPLLADGWPPAALYPEYFALPLLCTGQERRRGAWLPLWSYLAQAGYAFVLQLVLGRMAGSGYTGIELLRAWSLGYFSRLDALFLLVWLTAALWRMCMLAFVLRTLWQRNTGQKDPASAQNQNKGAST